MVKRLLLIVALCVGLATALDASRDFTKNVSNYISLGTNKYGPLLNGAASFSVGIWAQVDTLDASANNNRFLSITIANNATGVEIATDAASHLRIGVRAGSAEGLQTKDTTSTIPTDGRWVHLGGEVDIANDTITPYIDGVAEGGGAVTFTATTWTNGSHTNDEDAICNNFQLPPPPAGTPALCDGRVAELFVVLGKIGPEGFGRIGKRCEDPRAVASTASFVPMRADGPIRDFFTTILGLVTGVVPAAPDPPCFKNRRFFVNP